MLSKYSSQHTIPEPEKFKAQMLIWANRFNICALLDNHQYHSTYQNIDCVLAVGAMDACLPSTQHLQQLSQWLKGKTQRVFGHLSYDLKESITGIVSTHENHVGFPELYFFEPETVIDLKGNTLQISSQTTNTQELFQVICHIDLNIAPAIKAEKQVQMQARISKEQYIAKIHSIQEHIRKGDCYELNFCQEFFAEEASIDPIAVYLALNQVSPNPFACFYKYHGSYLLCASPERYLQQKNNRLVSQPIKGTLKRDLENPEQDQILEDQLRNSVKDRSENVMVVDLVRNDLSRVCQPGSVKVEELFGIYRFPQVHQMVSTVVGEPAAGMDLCAILNASFPMGSMTGAPKHKVMQLIEQYEQSRRGLYSGAVGYIEPNADFDFNVVIRSILYNQETKYLSYQVGGGITFYSDAEKEYEECLAKAGAIMQVLG
jgi:para-aminobenzoate synthetase component I